MKKKHPNAFEDIQLVGVHKEPTFGPEDEAMREKTCAEMTLDVMGIECDMYKEKLKQLKAELATANEENKRLKEFARHVIEIECWSLILQDGVDIQDLAEKLGLIVPHIATEQDIDDECDHEVGDRIFKFSESLRGE